MNGGGMYDPNNYDDVEPYQDGDEGFDDVFRSRDFIPGPAFGQFVEFLKSNAPIADNRFIGEHYYDTTEDQENDEITIEDFCDLIYNGEWVSSEPKEQFVERNGLLPEKKVASDDLSDYCTFA